MTHDQFEVLSNQAVAVSAVAYFLALLSHLVEWASARSVPAADRRGGTSESVQHAEAADMAADTGGSDAGGVAVLERTDVDHARVDRFARLGVVLTVVAAGVHLVAVVARGLAADPVRVPWGNMYEFTLTATLMVTLGYLLLHRRFGLDWLSPVVGAEEHVDTTLSPWVLSLLAVVVVAGGVAAAWFFVGRREVPREAPTDVSFVTRAARVDLYGDAANEELFVKPGYGLVHGVMAFDGGVVDGGTVGTGSALAKLSAQGRMVQNGFVRSYALVLLAGAALVLLALLVVTW